MIRTWNSFRGLLLACALGAACRPDFDALTSGSDDGGSAGTGGRAGGAGAGSAGCSSACSAGSDSGGGAGIGGEAGATGGGDSGAAGAGGEGGAEDCVIEPPTGHPPIVQYEFEEGSGSEVSDSSARGNHGTLVMGGWIAESRSGGGVEFTSVDQYVSLPENVVSEIDAMTVSAWVRLAAAPAGSTLFDFGSDATNHVYLRTNTGSGMRFGAVVAGADQGVSTPRTLPLDVWKHVAAVVSAGRASIYVDGLEIARGNVTFAPSDLGEIADNWIGRGHGAGASLAGAIDDFRIYDRGLGMDEIAELARPGSDYVHFSFDEPCGRRAHDRSELALVGELPQGGSWVPGRVGGALELDGERQYVALPDAIVEACRDLTLAFWMHRTSIGRPREHVLDFGQSQRTFMYVTPQAPGGGLRFAAKLNGAENDVTLERALTTPASVPEGLWQHVAVVLEEGVGRLYVNGMEVDERPIPMRPADMGATMSNAIGRSQYHTAVMPDPFYGGRIDDLRISCRAFAPNEIQLLALLP